MKACGVCRMVSRGFGVKVCYFATIEWHECHLRGGGAGLIVDTWRSRSMQGISRGTRWNVIFADLYPKLYPGPP